MNELVRRSTNELVVRATSRGALSNASAAVLTQDAIATEIDVALRRSHSVRTPPTRLLLVTLMPDDSFSMLEQLASPDGSPAGSKQASVVSGHNELLAGMVASSEGKRTMLQTRYLNGTLLNPFRPLMKCHNLTETNYRCTSGTPLFAQTILTLGTVLAKTEELVERGVPIVRTATLIMSDGESTESAKEGLAKGVRSLVADMRDDGNHIVAGMGFPSVGRGDSFRDVFVSMGIDPSLIFEPTTREAVLEAFDVFRRSALGELTIGHD